jgi:hypothetical protein
VTSKLKAYLEKTEALASVSEISKLTKFDGLEQHEVVALAALAQNLEHPEDNVTAYQIRQDMEAGGFNKLATTLALKGLSLKNFIAFGSHQDDEGHHYNGYTLTEQGWAWIQLNKDRFVLKTSPNF